MSAVPDTAGVSHPRRRLRLSLALALALLGAVQAGPVSSAVAAPQGKASTRAAAVPGGVQAVCATYSVKTCDALSFQTAVCGSLSPGGDGPAGRQTRCDDATSAFDEASGQPAATQGATAAEDGTAGQAGGESSSDADPNDSLVGNDILDLSNPACSSSALTVWQAGRCVRTGDPDVAYPVGNWQFDIHISTGILHPINNVYGVLETVLNTVWLILLYLLKYTLTLLSWAFSIAPFSNASTLGDVHSKLAALYTTLDSPWMNAVYILIGSYAAYLAFVRRRQSEAIGHLIASLVCILAALAVINAPAYFIGKPAEFANGFAQNAIAASDLAADNHTADNPTSKFAGLTANLFSGFAAGPFCALETNDVTWCESPPSSLEIKTVQAGISRDPTFQAQARAIAAEAASRLPASQQKTAYTEIFDQLTTTSTSGLTREDLFLRYPPGSTPRDALYELYSGENPDSDNAEGNAIASIISGAGSVVADATSGDLLAVAGDVLGTAASVTGDVLHMAISAVTTPIGEVAGLLGIGGGEKPKALAPNKVAIQGPGGVAQRVLVLGLTAMAMVGVLLVLIWIAVHLLIQALLGFVLLFAAAPMMLVPAFGPTGRTAFGNWAKTLLGALLAKAFYAAFLGTFVLALSVLQQATGTPGNGGWGAPWVMQCLLCWTVFMKRKQIVGFFSIDPTYHAQSGSAGQGAFRVLGSAYAASRLGGIVAGGIRRPIRNARINSIERRIAQDTATTELAGDMLSRQETASAQREFGGAERRAGIFQRALDKTGLNLDRLKQNPDYRQLVQHEASSNAYRELLNRPGGPGAGVTAPAPLPADIKARGEVIRAQVDRLQAGRSTLQKRYSEAQGALNTGRRNLAQHNSVLSPAELANRIDGRRLATERAADDANAWKRQENLSTVGFRRDAATKALVPDRTGTPMTAGRLQALERRSTAEIGKGMSDGPATRDLQTVRREVRGQMQISRGLLGGVPTRSPLNRGVATEPLKDDGREGARQVLHDHNHQTQLDHRAAERRGELRHQRYVRRHIYRG
jgi:hypothetical protein